MVSPRLIGLLVGVALVAGCGGDDPAATTSPTPTASQAATTAAAVTGELDLVRTSAPPDAGTQGGHRGGELRAIAEASTFAFAGTVRPPDAEVTVDGAQAAVERRDAGAFAVRLSGLAEGETEVVVRATAPGRKAWVERITVTRR